MSDQSKNAFEVKWHVENLIYWLQTRDDSLYSPQFLAETLTNTRWKLRLSQKFHLAEKYISLALERDVEDDHPEAIALNYELAFLTCDGSALKSKSCKSKFAPKTVSLELNVKEIEILEERKETFLPEGVLTVCCKLWKAWSTPKGGQCLIRSEIGRKCVTLDGNISYFSKLLKKSKLTANFLTPSSEISFISFDVQVSGDNIIRFEKGVVECKRLHFNSYKLYVLDAGGKKLDYFDSIQMASLLTSHKSYVYQTNYMHYNFQHMLKNDTLSLQLEITYSPGIKSECIEYADNNYKKLTDESVGLEKMNASNSENVHSCPLVDSLHLSEHGEIPCVIEKNESSDEDECSETAEKKHLPSTTLKEDLKSLYNDLLFCDTKLRTDTETFPAHRNVLSARSPVFKKMFTTDMKEKAGECINVPDISSDTVRRMLQFLYTDCIGDLEMQSAKDLYIASDKYDIASLKQRCSSFMKKNLCPANVCEVIVLADMHQDKDLASAAYEFVLIYDKEVFGSDEWRLFMKNSSNLAAEVMYLKCMKA